MAYQPNIRNFKKIELCVNTFSGVGTSRGLGFVMLKGLVTAIIII